MVGEAATDVAVEVRAFGICCQKFVIILRWNVEIPIDGAVSELQFEQVSMGKIRDCCQGCGSNDDSAHT